MSTQVFDKHGVSLTRFWGGEARGNCLQITIGMEYAQLEYKQLKEVLHALQKAFNKIENDNAKAAAHAAPEK